MARGDIDLEGMTVKQLRELRDRIDETMLEREKTEKQALKAKLAELASEAGFSLDDVLGNVRAKKGAKAAVKYRNPDNPNETWSGRGRKPTWLNEKMSKRGAKIEDFEV